MDAPDDLLDQVCSVVDALRARGLSPVLVGGMALVVLGSRRVTRDFDFVIARPDGELRAVLDIMYDRGLELAARVDAGGDVTATIDNRRVAAARLDIDDPSSAFFVQPSSGLRIDLLFDFPRPARELAVRATVTRIRSRDLRVASASDLLEMKKQALEARRVAGDADDVAFLERLQQER